MTSEPLLEEAEEEPRSGALPVIVALVLAVSALLSSYSGYQSTLWNGLQLEASAHYERELGREANTISGAFSLATLIFANALFFGGISLTQNRESWLKLSMVGISIVACAIGCWRIGTLPPA